MNGHALFAAAALAHLFAVMSPGPDFAMVVRQTLAHGRSAGVWTAIGIGSGLCVHVSWGLFGLGWLIERFPWLLEGLRYAGATFLIWMGWRALRAQPLPPTTTEPQAGMPERGRHYLIGLLTNLLNAKAMLFFVALCTTLVTAQAPVALRIALGSWMVLSSVAWFCFVSFTLSLPRVRLALHAQAHWIDRSMGALLLALGLGMLMQPL